MQLLERMYSVLLVSSSENFNSTTEDMLPPSVYNPITTAHSISEAKRLVSEREFDFIIINSPLPDESGTRFAIDCCHSPNTVVLLLARIDVYSDVHSKVSEHGVFTLQKPINKVLMSQALSWMASARERLRKLQKKTSSIEERMEEIRIINRAKLLLISNRNMTEPEAHKYLEKSAMDMGISKRMLAENVIKQYS